MPSCGFGTSYFMFSFTLPGYLRDWLPDLYFSQALPFQNEEVKV